MERPDLIFSYWIFVWYLLYFFGFFKLYNPKFAIILGIIENMTILFLMIYYKTKFRLILLFLTMFLILKIIPIYTIWNEKIKTNDIIFTFILFIIYLFWCIINNRKINNFTKTTKDLVFHNKNTLPGIFFLEKLRL